MAVSGMLISVVLITLLGLYFYRKKKLRYWADKAVPQDEPHFIFGNVKKVFFMEQSLYEYLEEQYWKYKYQPIVGGCGVFKPLVIVRDLEIIKDITIKEFGIFVNRTFHPETSLDCFAGREMFASQDDEWRAIRRRTAHAFSNTKLRNMLSVVKEMGEELVQSYKEKTKTGEKEVEIIDTSMRYAVDSITGVAFGSRGNCLRDYPNNSLMYNMLGKLLAFNLNQGIASNLIFFARPIYVALGYLGFPFYIFPKDVEEDTRQVVRRALEQRLKDKERRNDIFDQIVWSDEPELAGIDNKSAASFQMLVAGSETSAVTFSFALYELAKQPNLQDRLRKEIVDALDQNNGEVTFDLLQHLQYLDQVFNETLRMWPTLPFLDRVCQKDYQVPGTDVVIEKGTSVYIPLRAIHRDPQYFPSPNKFDPERFSPENVQSIPEMAFIPFGVGPRFCVGKRFGMMNVKSALVHFLSNFEVRTTKQTFTEPEWNKKAFTLSLQTGMFLSVRPLK